MTRKSIMSLALVAAVWASPSAAADGETALRCAVSTDAAIFARDAGSLPAIAAGRSIVVRTGQGAPAVMVDGWKPTPGPLSSVLTQLGSEAGFAVTGADGLGSVSWNGSSAPLTRVLDELTRQAGATWSFSSGVVRVSRGAPTTVSRANVPTPANRDVTLALLDTLRGYEARDVSLSPGGISFEASDPVMTRIRSGIAGVSEVYAFDVAFMRGRPSAGRYAWASLAPNAMADGAGGRVLLDDDADARLSAFLAAGGDVDPGSRQTVAGPAGWAVVAPQSQCGSGTTELTLRPRRVGDGFSLDVSGLGAPVSVPMVTLGQTLVLAAREPVGGWIRVVTIRPRIVAVR